MMGRTNRVSLYKDQMRQLLDRARWTAREQGLSAFVLKALRYPLKAFFVSGALTALQEGRRRVHTLEELFEFVNGFNYRGITITSWQKKAEIVSLLRFLEQSPPKRIAEIGTATGGTLFMLTQVAAPDATIVSVDLPGGKLGGVELGAQSLPALARPALSWIRTRRPVGPHNPSRLTRSFNG
jgi:hypothetical protein